VVLVLWLLAGCYPAPGPFRPRPQRLQGSPVCVRLPALAATAPAPQVDLDLNSDGERDYVVARPDSCDGEGNCDRDIYYVRESCAAMVGTVRAHLVKTEGSTVLAIERVQVDGQPGERETRWWMDAASHYRAQGAPVCRLEGTTASRPCAGEDVHAP
jgi:hypothetical protein